MKNRYIRVIIGFTISLLFLGTSLTTTLATALIETDETTFTDVPETHANFDALEFLNEKGIVGGYEDGSFKPGNTINRAEAMKMVMQGRSIWKGEAFIPSRKVDGMVVADGAEGDETEAEGEPILFTFGDVPEGEWFTNYVYTAHDLEIAGGYEDGTFKPANNINKAEALKIIMLSFTDGAQFTEPGKNPFADVPFSSWYGPYVQYAKDRMIIDPDENGKFNGQTDITRGEFAEIIYRLIYIAVTNQKVFDQSVNWESFNRSVLGYITKIPNGWRVIEETAIGVDPNGGEAIERTVFWAEDKVNGQGSYLRQFPNSATAEIVLSNESVDRNTFFAKIRNSFGNDAIILETATKGLPTLLVTTSGATENILDAYIHLPDGRIAAIYGTYGNGGLAYKNEFYLRKIRENFEYTERSVIDDSNKADILTIARGNIQVDGKGRETLDLFDDLEIIETDTIGVGTGPVDYYFSAKANVTLKYERSFDVVLDIVTGNTSSF